MIPIFEEKKVSRAESVYLYLKEKIIYNEYPPGTILREGELATKLNVSKTPIRETLNTLRGEGLVEVIPYKGYIISQLSLSDFKDLLEFRTILECAAAERAIDNIAGLQLQKLKQLASVKPENNVENLKKEYMKVNANFHCYLGEASGNQQLAAQMKDAIHKLQRNLFMTLNEDSFAKMEEEHLAIIAALEAGDKENIKELLIHHIQGTYRI